MFLLLSYAITPLFPVLTVGCQKVYNMKNSPFSTEKTFSSPAGAVLMPYFSDISKNCQVMTRFLKFSLEKNAEVE